MREQAVERRSTPMACRAGRARLERAPWRRRAGATGRRRRPSAAVCSACTLHLRYEGTDTALVPAGTGASASCRLRDAGTASALPS